MAILFPNGVSKGLTRSLFRFCTLREGAGEERHGVHPYDWTDRVRRVWRGLALFS
jgi:hypothetical protein